MGLNDTYLLVRIQILLMNPLPSINQTFSMIIEIRFKNPLFMDENIESNVSNFENVAMYAKEGASQKLRKNYNL